MSGPDQLVRVTELHFEDELLCLKHTSLADCEIPASFNRSLLGVNLVGRIMETLVARREAFERVGLFDTSFRTAEDVDWYARAKDLGIPMKVLPDVLLEKRVHDDNASTSGAQNMPHLMEALRRSIARRKGKGT